MKPRQQISPYDASMLSLCARCKYSRTRNLFRTKVLPTFSDVEVADAARFLLGDVDDSKISKRSRELAWAPKTWVELRCTEDEKK